MNRRKFLALLGITAAAPQAVKAISIDEQRLDNSSVHIIKWGDSSVETGFAQRHAAMIEDIWIRTGKGETPTEFQGMTAIRTGLPKACRRVDK
jgi:hypothetical protein